MSAPTVPPDAPPQMRLYRLREAMALLAVSRTTLYALMDSGALRSVWVGRARRIPGTAIADYIAHLENQATA
ncbi:helix-turn-helix domain-containing protein [Actinomadura formosensis]|uniref:helix-turn-helix domain-containing protein n=1 Tax=Actinomadura formosensis TaxID=60706 RepID=UPI001F5FDB63|nr:helix-turn-helix domain-containing protein [Actinomadura formosensis]